MASLLKADSAPDCLSAHLLFRAAGLDETRAQVARVFKPHQLSVRGTKQRLDARMDHLRIGNISLNRLRYGADVSIEPERLESFLLVQMPLHGTAEIQCGRQKIFSTPALASVITPTLPLSMLWGANCDQLIVRIERAALERACSTHLGHELSRPLEFELGLDMGESGACNWHRLVAFLASDSQFASGASHSPLVTAHLEQLVICTLLTCQPHNYREELLRPAPVPAPYYVRRAEEYMMANADQAITIQEIARHAGVSTRSLFAGFRQFRDTSPMAFLRDVRLNRVREELLQAASGENLVTRTALKWGFAHLGHFAAAYRKKFDESPSETLRR